MEIPRATFPFTTLKTHLRLTYLDSTLVPLS